MLYAQVFDGDEALVVVHGDDCVAKRRGGVGLGAGGHEDGVGRVGAACVYALGAGCGDGGGDGVDFFAPEHAAFACVGVEACYGDDGGAGGLIGGWCAGLCLELLRQEAVGDGDCLQQLLLRDGFYGLAQADVDAVEYGFEFGVGEHHAYGHVGNGCACVLCGEGLQHFGVTWKWFASECKCFFVDGRGDEGGAVAAQGGACGVGDAVGSHAACGGLYLAKGGQGGRAWAGL